MFGEPGHLYVYFTYGLHWGSNAVCGEPGQGWGVLLRALEPVHGLEAMRALRPKARRDRDLACGPGKLSQAMGLTGADDGADLVSGAQGVALVDDGVAPPERPAIGPRVGISKAMEFPWRFHVPGHLHVSARRIG